VNRAPHEKLLIPPEAPHKKSTAHFSDFLRMRTKKENEKQSNHKQDHGTRPQEVIYGADKKLQSTLRRVGYDKINGKSMLQLYQSLTAERLAVLTRLSTIERLVFLSKILGKPFKNLTKED